MSDFDRAAWTVADAGGVGRALHDAVPSAERPDWVAAILLQATRAGFDCPEIRRLVELSFDGARWAEARGVFDALRARTLDNGRAGRSRSREQRVLDIAEIAAKVICNCRGGHVRFDHNAGWRLAPRLRVLVEDVGDPRYEDECWALLTRTPASVGPS